MHGDPEFVILKYQSWLDTAKFEDKILGAIVKEFLQPTNNYAPDAPLKYNTHDLTEGSVTDFVLDNSGSKGHEGAASLGSIAGVSFHGSIENSANLSGRIIRYKRLQQHDQFWAKLKADPVVQATVPYWIDRFSKVPVCLVVGIMICEDVETSYEGKESIEREGHVELPIGQTTLALGAPNPVGSVVDPKISLGSTQQTVTLFKGKVGESRIFALELKKIAKEGWIKKALKLKSQGPDVDATRLAAGDDDDDSDDDEVENVDELALGELSQEEFEDLVA